MLNSIITGSTATGGDFLLCLLVSLILGIAIAFFHSYKNNYSRNFLITLALLPAIVQSVIMLVNGNLGAGVAVAGAFSLVRFRSVPGNSREITSVFLAMAVGLAAGMGCIGIAVILTVVIGAAACILSFAPIHDKKESLKELKITIPENLDYSGIFDDIFREFTISAVLNRVKTVNMGSLYELVYQIQLKDSAREKEMLDEIRVRNGNLEIVCGRVPDKGEQL